MNRYRNIDSGSTVYGSDGNKIGTVKDCTSTYCHIDTGFLGLGPDYYIPMDNISDVRPGEVYLDVPSNRVSQMGWDREPAGRPISETTRRAGVMPEARPAEEARGREEVRGRGLGERERHMELEEERLRATKHREQTGEVDIHKEVVEEQREFTVPVSHEEVVVSRRDVDRETTEPIGGEETIRIPVSEEKVDIRKEPHVYGEIDVEKREVTEQRHVSGTVRKEVPRVERKGEAESVVEEEAGMSEQELRERRERELRERRER